MFEKIDKIVKIILYIALRIIILLGVSMLALTLVAVFFRYVLGNSIGWAEEVLKIALVWFGLLSVGVIAYRRQHIGIVIIKQRLPKKVQEGFALLTQVLLLAVSIVMFYTGTVLMLKAQGSVTPALRIPYMIPYLGIPLSFGFMVIYEVRNIIFDILKLLGKLPESYLEKENDIEEASSE